MIPYKKEKRDNAICFFALNHKRKTGKYLPQTFLYKYLAFLDFNSIKDTGEPALGYQYRAMEKGPVPTSLYNKRENLETELYEFQNVEDDKYIIKAKKEPDLNYFCDYEIKEMERLINQFANPFTTTEEISEVSHRKILAWGKTQRNKYIDYKLNFRHDILKKKDENLTPVEKHFLTFLAVNGS